MQKGVKKRSKKFSPAAHQSLRRLGASAHRHSTTRDDNHMTTRDDNHMTTRDDNHMTTRDDNHMTTRDDNHMTTRDDHMGSFTRQSVGGALGSLRVGYTSYTSYTHLYQVSAVRCQVSDHCYPLRLLIPSVHRSSTVLPGCLWLPLAASGCLWLPLAASGWLAGWLAG